MACGHAFPDRWRGPDARSRLDARAPATATPGSTRAAGSRTPNLGPGVRQVVLDGRVREAEAVGGGLLRSGRDDGGDYRELARGRSPGRRSVRVLSQRSAKASYTISYTFSIDLVSPEGQAPCGWLKAMVAYRELFSRPPRSIVEQAASSPARAPTALMVATPPAPAPGSPAVCGDSGTLPTT